MSIRKLALLIVAFLPFGKRPIYILLFGARIEKGARFGFGAILLFETLAVGSETKIGALTLIDAQNIDIGPRCRIGSLVQMRANSFVIGPSSTIGSQTVIKGNRADNRSAFSCGAECWIFEYCFIDVTRQVSLGRNVGVGGGTYIFSHGFWLSKLHGYPVSYGRVTIENDVWLPWDCFIMPGVTLGTGAVIGARSLLTKDVPAGALAAGVPAKVVREKVARDVDAGEKIEMLIDASREFCVQHRHELEVTERTGWSVLAIDGKPTIGLARAVPSLQLPPDLVGILEVVDEPLGETASNSVGPRYSIATFQSTPRGTFSPVQSAWIYSLRSIGCRQYPIDEIKVEHDALGGGSF